MKKYKIIILMLLLIMPKMVMAVEITEVKLTTKNDTVKVGDSFDVVVKINYSDVTKGVNSGYGVKEIIYELKFDDEKFMPTAIKTDGFDSAVIKYDGGYYGYSAVANGNMDGNKCYDNILYCAPYQATITFFVRNSEATNGNIALGDVGVDVYAVADDDSEVTELEYTSNAKVTITIKKNTSSIVTEPTEITQYTMPQESSSKTTSTTKETYANDSDKSANAYLKSLTIKGYTLDFYKRTKNYELEVEKGVNNLEIEAKLDDEKSLLEVKGADDLKANNYKVEIIVTAEDGSKNTYTITVKEEQEKKTIKLSGITLIAKLQEIYTEYKLYIFIGLGCLALFIVIAIIVNRISDKKLGNKFDEF